MSDGQFDGKVHILPVRVYYEDTDLSGIVYHANYLRYMERGRMEFFRGAGVAEFAHLENEEPTAWTLRKVQIEYFRPARLNDLLEVRTRLTELTGARMSASQQVYCRGQQLTQASVEACVITLQGKPRRIPKSTYEALAPYLYETTA
ncbi:MAG TPA: YbgC/FadM family acyl-CoA thioesterase [Rhizomicrobium sp.]|jgi:acyl-CoA thioester hydrolase|nr:YbgC/FadM family acyl-CoA thioesterase [Rhizomicrobium sp.]